MEGNSCGLFQGTTPRTSLMRLKKTTKNIGWDSQSLGQDINLGPPKYKAGVVTTQLWHSVHPSYCSILHPWTSVLYELQLNVIT